MAQTSSPTRVKRVYRSSVRAQRALETRERILVAARTEFLRSGYSATTMRAVAMTAGVSVATVELVFGTKPALLQAAISFSIRGDSGSTPMLQRDWAAKAATTESASGFLDVTGRVLGDSAQRSAGLVAAALESAAQDESLRALAEQLRAQRRETSMWIVDGVIERAPLRRGIDREQATDTVWLLMDPRLFCAATRDCGWSADAFAQWFAGSVARLLLAPDPAPSGRSRNARGPAGRSPPKSHKR